MLPLIVAHSTPHQQQMLGKEVLYEIMESRVLRNMGEPARGICRLL